MRGCGHAHHHDDLYLGAESGNPPGYVDRELLTYWSEKDPIPNHRELLVRLGVSENKLSKMEEEEQVLVDAARKHPQSPEFYQAPAARRIHTKAVASSDRVAAWCHIIQSHSSHLPLDEVNVLQRWPRSSRRRPRSAVACAKVLRRHNLR